MSTGMNNVYISALFILFFTQISYCDISLDPDDEAELDEYAFVKEEDSGVSVLEREKRRTRGIPAVTRGRSRSGSFSSRRNGIRREKRRFGGRFRPHFHSHARAPSMPMPSIRRPAIRPPAYHPRVSNPSPQSPAVANHQPGPPLPSNAHQNGLPPNANPPFAGQPGGPGGPGPGYQGNQQPPSQNKPGGMGGMPIPIPIPIPIGGIGGHNNHPNKDHQNHTSHNRTRSSSAKNRQTCDGHTRRLILTIIVVTLSLFFYLH